MVEILRALVACVLLVWCGVFITVKLHGIPDWHSLVAYNDYHTSTKEDILKLIDTTLEKLK